MKQVFLESHNLKNIFSGFGQFNYHLVKALAKQPTRAFAGIKEAINRSTFYGLDEQLEAERVLQVNMGETHDFKEGVSAFLEKRSPKFKGE